MLTSLSLIAAPSLGNICKMGRTRKPYQYSVVAAYFCYFVRLPVIGTAVQQQLLVGESTEDLTGTQGTKHQPVLIRAVAEELGVSVGDISDMELCLADHSPAVSLYQNLV